VPKPQLLTHSLRLPDACQADALRLLATSRESVNAVLVMLWPRLDEFVDGQHQAWKHLTSLLPAPHANGSRQWRCEAETAGRILRSQAARKAAFDALRTVLTEGLIQLATPKYRARKDRRALLQTVRDLRAKAADDADALGLLLNVAEQACNFYLEHDGRFPADYFELQPIPVLEAGLLTYAADDGPEKGQAYRLLFEKGVAKFTFRGPDASGAWRWWEPVDLPLPEQTLALVFLGVPAAPQLRAVVLPNQAPVAVLDLIFQMPAADLPDLSVCRRVLSFDWGVRKLLTATVLDVEGRQVSRPIFFDSGSFDGRQARLRRQIDQLKAKQDRLPKKDPDRVRFQRAIDLCWAAYDCRNRALAHLAANFLILVAGLYDCQVIAGEWLATLKSVGRGRDTRSRWRNWRNNTTLRSALTTLLEYKAKLAGFRTRFEYPRGTSHTCPRCGQPADTFKSPEHTAVSEWGAWLKCAACGWNGSRDYAAALNIGRLAVAYVMQVHTSPEQKPKRGFRISDASRELKPVSYTGAGAALPFPPPGLSLICPKADPLRGTIFSIRGWPDAVTIHPARPLVLQC
jgi:putative transposase